MDKKLLSHYGKAIFEYALDNNILENVKEELSLVNETLNDNVNLQKFLSSPLIPINEKNEKIENIFSKYISKDILSYDSVVDKIYYNKSLLKEKDFLNLMLSILLLFIYIMRRMEY